MSRHRPASTLARFKRRPTCLAAWLLAAAPVALAPWALALPQGAVPSSGQATVQLTAPGVMLIQQTSARAGLDWTAFSIAAGERVQVQQPSSSAVLLNRVLGDSPSGIYGSLSSNGNVWLINPRGIVFGVQSRVDVGGLVASTLSLSTADFAAGRLHLRADANTTGAPAALVAEGHISAAGGAVVLVAPQLTQRGSIDARRVGLAAGSDVLVDVDGDGLLFFHVRNDRLDSALDQLGRVRADGGTVDIRAAARAGLAGTVLNLEGVVQARSVGQLQGRIWVDGGDAGITRVAGRLDASADTQGGDLLVQGRYIAVERSAVVDASGAAGGGSVRIGGDFQGRNAAVRNAERVVVMAGAELSADSLVQGDGGRVVVWSDGSTRFLGSAHARGGPQGGDGGLVEVSGKAYLDYRGQSDRSAPKGRAGRLLLDPDNITVQLNAPDIDGASPGTDLTSGTLLFAAPGASSVITAGAVVGLLANGSVELQAQADISVTSAIEQPAGNHGLSLRAGNNITVTKPISVGGDILLSAHDRGATIPSAAGRVEVTAPLTAGGTLTITNNIGGTGRHRLGHNLSAGSLALTGDAELTADSTWTLASDSATSSTLRGAGALTKAGAGVLTLSGVAGYTGATRVTGGGLKLAAALSSTTVDVNAGALNLAASNVLADTAVVSVAAGATLSISAADTIGELVLRGTLAGGVGNTLTTAGATTLDGGTVSASLAANTLGSSGLSTLLASVAVTGAAAVTGGTLTIGSNGTTGALSAASISVAAGAALVHRRSDAVTLGPGFSVSGAGRFAQAGDGNLLLGGGAQQLATANINVGAGGLALLAGEADRIADTSAVVLNGATLTINNASETIGTLALTGATLLGSGELSTGALTSSGASRIANTVRATGATITAGVLTVGNNGATGELATSGALTVHGGAVLAFERAAGADLTLAGVAGPGAIVQRGGNVLRLAGTSPDITTLDVVSGTLRLANGAGNRINDNAAVTVATGASLVTGNGDESVATLALAGTLGGAGALTANVYTLQGGAAVNSPLGLGELRVTGNATLNAPAAALLVNVHNGGSLTLGAAGAALSDAALLNVASGGTLSTTAPETVGTLNLAGTLSGAFALTAGSTTLQQGALVSGTLGGGALVVAGTGTITGTAASGSVNFTSGGTLLLSAAQRLTAPPSLRFEAGGRLTLNGDQSATTVGGNINVDGNGRLLAQALVLNNSSIAVPLVTHTLTSDGVSSVLSTVTVNNGTSVNSGVLTVGDGASNGALAGAGTLTVAAGATLAYNRSDTVVLNSLLGGGTLRQAGSGELQIQGRLAMPVIEVARGTLSLAAGNDNRVVDTATVRVDSGSTLTLNNASETVASLTLAGRLRGAGSLTAANVTLQAGAVVDATLGGGTLSVSGNSRLNASSGAQTVQVQAGTLTLGSAQRLLPTAVATVDAGATLLLNGDQSLASFISAGVLAASSGADTLLAAQVRLLAGASVNARLGAGILTVQGDSRLNAAAAAHTVDVAAGTLTLGAAELLSNTAGVTIGAGAGLALTGTETVGTLASSGNVGGSGQTLAAGSVTLNAGASISADLSSPSVTVTGNSTLAGAANATTVAVIGGRLSLAAAQRLAGNANVTVAAAAQLALGGNQQVASLALAGALEGAGRTLTAASTTLNSGATVQANLGTGTLRVAGNSSLSGTAAASTVLIDSGATLTLGSAERLHDSSALTTNGRLVLTGNQTVGTLAGSGSIELGAATLHSGSAGSSSFGGSFSGSGDVDKQGAASTFTLTAAQAHTGSTTVSAGTLVLAGGSALAPGGALVVASGATASVVGAQRVRSLNLAGTLAGNGTLTADQYTLDSGRTLAGAALGAGVLRSSGASLLGGTSAAGTLLVSSGALTLGAAARLTGLPAVTVAAGASLALAGNEQAGSLDLGGTLNGPGHTLRANTHTLNGGAVVNANLGGRLVAVAGDSQLSGRVLSDNLVVNVGTLTLAATPDRIGDHTAVAVAGGARLLLNSAETVAALTLAGTVASNPAAAHRLTASGGSTLLTGAQVLVPLGGPTLRVTGDSLLAANADAAAVNIDSGQLNLAGAQRLAEGASVQVARDARLVLDGAERIGTLQLEGTLQGSGTLSASRYTLNGGTVVADLGTGSMVSRGNSNLRGVAAVADVAVDSGTLTLAGAQRLTAAPAMNVAAGATLQLQGELTLAGLSGTGTVALDAHALRVGQGLAADTSSSYGGTITGAGSLRKVGAGRWVFNGSGNQTGSTTVAAGTLQLGGTLAGTEVQVSAGARLLLAAAERLSDAATVTVAGNGVLSLGGTETVTRLNLGGRLDGSGLLQAATVALDGATVVADLGTGTLSSRGASALSGRSGAATVLVSEGSLALATPGRLAATASVTVASAATLQVGGDTTVASLTLAGSLSGLGASTGSLSAGQVLLDGGSTSYALGAGALRSIGSSTLGARSDASTLAVESGTLNITRAQATASALLTTVNAGATLQLSADQTMGSLAGSGDVALGSFTLSTGGAGNSNFGGRLQGSGNLVKAGSSEFTLSGSNSYTGSTTVQAGTLTVGGGGTQGSLASSTLVVHGTLKMARSDAVTLAQPISGSGTLEQAGSGRLTLAGSNKTYGGATRVNTGELATANAEALPDSTALQVAAGASLSLGGNETLRSIAATGSTTLAGNVSASEDLLFDGPVTAAGNAAVQLSGRRISASHAGNRWGTLSLNARDLLTIGAGTGSGGGGGGVAEGATAAQTRELVLGDVSAANGGRIEAGVLTLTGTTAVSRGTLDLVAHAPLQAAAPSADATPKWDNKVAAGLALAPAAAAVQQTGGSIQVASGAQLNVQASQGGSVLLTRDDNRYIGALQVLSGAAFSTPWDANVQNATLPGRPPQNTAVQGLVQVHGSTVNVGGRGIEADVVSIKATTLATPVALAPPAAAGAASAPPTIVARLPFDNTVGTAQSLPALTLWLNDAAFSLGNPFGANNGSEIRIDVGSRALGAGRNLSLDAGYIIVLPRGRAQGSTSVLLAGPQVSANGYRFFSDGAGVQGEIPVFYNGVLPNTPQVESLISATVSVSEGARRERFEEAVRTENVAVRLRAGVIAEVGPGRPATHGVQGAQTPQICPPAPGSLRCELLVPAPR